MIVGVLTTCHTQYTWDRSICIFLFNRTTLQVFVTYLTGALYVHPLWFYKHQHDNRVRSKLFVACQRWWFQWRFAAILVNSAPSGEMHNYCIPHFIKENYENFLIHRCNYILLSQVYCVWQDVKTTTIIFNNPLLNGILQNRSLCGHWKMWWKKINLSSTTNVSIRSVIHALQTLAIECNCYAQNLDFIPHIISWFGGGGGWKVN